MSRLSASSAPLVHNPRARRAAVLFLYRFVTAQENRRFYPPALQETDPALRPDLKVFPEISHAASQRQLDRQATQSLSQVPLIPTFTRFLSEKVAERYMRIKHTSSSIRVNARQSPSLHKQDVKMALVLDVRKLPELYITTSLQINAFAMGMENYSIVVCSALIDLMTEDELLAIIGHELGRVKCDHVLYNLAANALRNFGNAIIEQALPMGRGQVGERRPATRAAGLVAQGRTLVRLRGVNRHAKARDRRGRARQARRILEEFGRRPEPRRGHQPGRPVPQHRRGFDD